MDKPAKMGRKCNQKSYITHSFEVFESVEFGDLSYILNVYDWKKPNLTSLNRSAVSAKIFLNGTF